MDSTQVRRNFFLIAGPLSAFLIALSPSPSSEHPHLMYMAALTIWVAIWWFTEVVHIAVTSLLPFLFFPILGISDLKTVSAQYMDPVLFLFIGGFFLAFAIERWGLHRRIALKILSAMGDSPSKVLLGIMLASYILSMWISNTATVMMLLSAVLAVIVQLDQQLVNKHHHRKLAAVLMIGLAYSATIGGMATLVGTPPNMIFYRAYLEAYPNNNDLNFSSWFTLAFPLSLLFLAFTWLVLRSGIPEKEMKGYFDKTTFLNDYKSLGTFNRDEKKVSIIFLLTAILWFSRADIDLGSILIPGWSRLFPHPDQIQDGAVAITMAILLFIIPSSTEKGRPLLTWKETKGLPYEIILLFGSGFALAKGFEQSGLSVWLAGQLIVLKGIHPFILLLVITTLVTIISEFASNVASIQLVLPILIALQHALNLPPLLLLLPATLAASLGFMLPIATAPNTIVFSSGHIKVNEMASTGFKTNIIGILLISIFSYIFLT